MNPIIAAMLVLGPTGSVDVKVERAAGWASLNLNGTSFHRTRNEVTGLAVTGMPGTTIKVVTWDEVRGGERQPYFAVSLDGTAVQRVAETSNTIRTIYGAYDPLESTLPLDARLKADTTTNTYVVQFKGQALNQFRQALVDAGARILNYLPDNAYVVILPQGEASTVEAMPFVRSVSKLDPGVKMGPELQRQALSATAPRQTYDISVGGDDVALKQAVIAQLKLAGAEIVAAPDRGQMVEAVLTPAQVLSVAKIDGVMFLVPQGKLEQDMDNVRVIAGSNYVETVAGYQGQGVNAQVIDFGLQSNPMHVDYAGRITVRGGSGNDAHGTSCAGIVYGNGTGNATGKGMMPLANGVFYGPYSTGWSGAFRLQITEQTVNQFQCVIESNSWGNPRNWAYDSISSYMDEIVYKTDLALLQSMSNAGSTQGRPQVWGKNIIGIGAVNHFNNQNTGDDRWSTGATIGPAPDGRIKPDMLFYYDSIFCPNAGSSTAYTSSFGGTSAATPMSAGAFGIGFQMWHDGIFGNTNLGSTVFANRMKSATSRALMIATATMYPNTQLDIERRVQGWGRPDLRNLYDSRNQVFVVDESDLLQQLETKTYVLNVGAGTPAFKASMVYTDYWAAAFSNPNRINNLSMKVTDPNGVVYWANNGMGGNGTGNNNDLSNWTLSGGAPETLNTTQNVFVENPSAGKWTIEIKAEALPQDGHPETAGVIDQGFGLAVSGVQAQVPTSAIAAWKPGALISGGVAEALKSDQSVVLCGAPLAVGGGGIVESGVSSTHNVPFTNLGGLTVVAETESTIASTPIEIQIFNTVTNSWEVFAVGNAGAGKSRRTATPTGDLSRFLNGNQMRVAVVFKRNTSLPAQSAWRNRIDHVRLFVNPL